MYNVATWSPDCKLGAVALKAAGLEAASTNSTAVEVGKGKFRAVLTWTACEVDTGDEFYNIVIEANTRAVTGTWKKIASLGCYGCAALTSDTVTPAAGAYEMIVDNPYDYQVRVTSYIRGTFGTGMNYSVDAYPLADKN